MPIETVNSKYKLTHRPPGNVGYGSHGQQPGLVVLENSSIKPDGALKCHKNDNYAHHLRFDISWRPYTWIVFAKMLPDSGRNSVDMASS